MKIFMWSRDIKKKKKVCATYLVKLTGVKVVAYGRKKIIMFLLSFLKEGTFTQT